MDDNSFKWRLIAVKLSITCFFIAILLKLSSFIELYPTDEFQPQIIQLSSDNPLKPKIYDRNHHLVASSILTYSLYADPKEIIDPEEAAEALVSQFPELNFEQLRTKLSSNLRFLWIKRKLTPKQFQNIHNMGIPGLSARKEYKRIYPTGNLLSHLVGFRDTDGKGLRGIERSIDHLDVFQNKETIELSIDIGVQNIIHQELVQGIKEFNAIGGTAILMKANTGEIVSMLSVPDFNPHDLNGATKEQLFNKPCQGAYELGSTYKILNHAIALDSNTVTFEDEFDASKPLMIGKYKIDDYFGKKRVLSVPEVLIYSSNIGSAKIAQKVGIETQQDYLRKMGMLYPTMIELQEKVNPLIPTTWREANTMTIGYGYGIAVSPLHLTAAVASILNGGIYYNPTLFKKTNEDVLYGERIFAEDTSVKLRDLLYQSTGNGRSKTARVKGYFVGGKTGTGLKAGVDKYHQDTRISSFIGAFPIYNPEYVLYIMIDEPKGTKTTYGYATGGWVSAPIAGRVISKIAPMLDIKPEFESDDHFKKLLDLNRKQNYKVNTSYPS